MRCLVGVAARWEADQQANWFTDGRVLCRRWQCGDRSEAAQQSNPGKDNSGHFGHRLPPTLWPLMHYPFDVGRRTAPNSWMLRLRVRLPAHNDGAADAYSSCDAALLSRLGRSW